MAQREDELLGDHLILLMLGVDSVISPIAARTVVAEHGGAMGRLRVWW